MKAVRGAPATPTATANAIGAGAHAAPHARDPSLASRAPRTDSLLGIRVPPDVAHGALLAILILLAGTLVIVLLIADDAGVGPRHRQWRAYWSERFMRH